MVDDLLGLRPAQPGTSGPSVAVISGGGRPRFVVPTDTTAAAAASCWAYNRLRDRRTRTQRSLIGAAFRVGASAVLRPQHFALDTSDESLFAHLSAVLGRDDLCMAVGLGTFDTVWKPTLQVMSRSGAPVAYVKVGWTPFTTALVETEAATLAALGTVADHDRTLVAPTLLHHGVWRDRTLVAVSPLPRDVRRIVDDHAVPSPEVVVALGATRASGTLAAGAWWDRLANSVRLGAGHPTDATLAAALDRVGERFGDAQVDFGRWHGDWTPWNLATSPSQGLVAWDWEYSAPDAPVGLDALHSDFQVRRLLDGSSATAAFRGAAARAERWCAAIHPLVVAERVQAALRAGCELDAGGAESLESAPGAVEAVLQ